MYDNDAKIALSSWADSLEHSIERIRTLVDMFKGKALMITHTSNNIVYLEGDEEVLEKAVELKILHNDNSLLNSEYRVKVSLSDLESLDYDEEHDFFR